MPESTPVTGTLETELRRYFALTTSVDLPAGVRMLGRRSLESRSRPRAPWLPIAGLVAAAAVVVVLVARPGSHGASSSGLYASGAGSSAAEVPKSVGVIAYPGVDTGALFAAGVRLLPPGAVTAAHLAASQAQAAAVHSVGARAGVPGPPVLTRAGLAHLQPASCLCWAVDVPVAGGLSTGPGGAPVRTVLVLVDAVTGRIEATLTGNGIP